MLVLTRNRKHFNMYDICLLLVLLVPNAMGVLTIEIASLV